MRPDVATPTAAESLAMTRMLAATDPWLIGEAEGVTLGIMLEELKDMVVDTLTEELGD